MANPVVLQAQSGFATEISVAKSWDSPHAVVNGGSNSSGIAPILSTISSPLAPIPAISGNTPGAILLPNPVLPGSTTAPQPGLYSVFLDFGAAGGPTNISCIAYYGVGIGGSAPLRWLGGAECSIITQTAGAPTSFVQIAPEAATGEQLTIANYSSVALTGGEVYFVQLAGNASGNY